MQSKTIDLGYAEIFIKSFGKGKPLFLIPGWPLSSRVFELLEPYLSDKYRAISLDLPGWAGQSKIKENQGYYQVDYYVKIIEDVLDSVYPDEENIAVFGASAGAVFAFLAAANLNPKIGKIIAQSPPYIGPLMYRKHLFRLTLARWARHFSPLVFFLDKLFRYGYLWQEKSNGWSLPHSFREGIIADAENFDRQAILDFLKDFTEHDYSEVLQQIKNEVVVINCEKDKMVPPTMVRKLANQIISHAKYYEVSDMGHTFLVDDPEKLAQIIINEA